MSLGMDVGKTKTRIGAVDADGNVAQSHVVPTPQDVSAEEAFQALLGLVDSFAGSDVEAVGVAVSGAVDSRGGRTIDGGGSPFVEFPLAARLHEATGLRVALDNDANFAALGEAAFGAGADSDTIVYLTVSTGIGCGIVVGRRVVHGANNAAGELWQVPLAQLGKTVEEAAGGLALSQAASAAFGRPTTTAEVFALAVQGDETSERLIANATSALEACSAWIRALIDPDILVVGGSVAINQPSVAAALASAHRGVANVAPAALDGRAEIVGAAYAASTA